MTKQPLFRLAKKSIANHLWINLRLCLVFALVAVIVGLFTAFNYSVNAQAYFKIDQAVSSDVFWSNKAGTDVENDLGVGVVQTLRVQRYDLVKMLQMPENYAPKSVTGNYLDVELHGKRYRYATASTSDKDFGMDYVWVYAGSPFTVHDEEEMQMCFGDAPIYYGKLPVEPLEAMVSEDFILRYGLTIAEVLGNDITVFRSNTDAPLGVMTVCGVISSEFFQLSGHSYLSDQICPTVILSQNNPLPDEFATTYDIYALDGWPDRDFFDWGGYFDANWQWDVHFSGITSVDQMTQLERMQVVVVRVYTVIGGIILLGMVLTVMLMLDKFASIFCRTGGIALSCGLKQRNLYMLLLAQILLMFAMSLPIAALGCAFGYWGINALVETAMGITMITSVRAVLLFAVIGAGLALLSAIIFFGVSVAKIGKKSVKELLATEVQ